MEHQPAGDRCGRVQMNVDIVGSRRNGPQLSTRHDDDDDESLSLPTVQICLPYGPMEGISYILCIIKSIGNTKMTTNL